MKGDKHTVEAFHKRFDPTRLFSLDIVYQDSKNAQNELPLHFHEWYEIVYVYQGKGTFLIDQSIQTMEAGNVFIIPGNTIHRAIPDKVDPVMSTALFFNPNLVQSRLLGDAFHYLFLFDESTRLKNYKYHLEEKKQQSMESFLLTIFTEMDKKKLGYRHASLIQLQELLIFLSRHSAESKNDPASMSYSCPLWMNTIFTYIEKNYTDDISLEKLAICGNVSPAHLSRVFKKMTGLNISEYIMTKKILKAKELLLRTEKKVADIAGECGFDSMPYFHRTFKKYTGVTPSSYRKEKKVEMA